MVVFLCCLNFETVFSLWLGWFEWAGKDANLGIEVKRKSRQAGIANLSYREISKIFAYLDADTILMIHKSAVDVQSFRKKLRGTHCPIRELSRYSEEAFAIVPAYTTIPRCDEKLAGVRQD